MIIKILSVMVAIYFALSFVFSVRAKLWAEKNLGYLAWFVSVDWWKLWVSAAGFVVAIFY